MPRTRVTLPDVAEEAGVSVSSASRALHGRGASPAMVARLRRVAADLGYRPDPTGRSLRMRRTMQIALAVADLDDPAVVTTISAIHRAVAVRGYRLLITETGAGPAAATTLLADLAAASVDGIVLGPLPVDDALLRAARGTGRPVVVLGHPTGQSPRTDLRVDPSHAVAPRNSAPRSGGGVDRGVHAVAVDVDQVSTDSAPAVTAAVRHLLELGRRRLGFLNGPPDTVAGAARHRGILAAAAELAAAGAELVDTQAAMEHSVPAGSAAASELLGRHRHAPLDAVVAADDLLALGAVRAAAEFDLAVPRDLAVTGVDDTDLARLHQPSLTSVSLGTARRGRAAAELLLDRLADPARPAQVVRVAPRLVARASTIGVEPATGSPAALTVDRSYPDWIVHTAPSASHTPSARGTSAAPAGRAR